MLEKWLGVNEKLSPKSGSNGSIWVILSPYNFRIY
jgi:hypothetical protein